MKPGCLQRDLRAGAAGSEGGVRDASADHLFDDFVAGGLGGGEGAAHPSVAHDDDAVRYLEHFGETVGNEDDGHAACPQHPHPVEQAHRLPLGQRRCGFVEDQ